MTDIFEVDAFSDAVYSLCNGRLSNLDIAKAMVARYESEDPVSVVAHALYNLAVFERQGFIVPVNP